MSNKDNSHFIMYWSPKTARDVVKRENVLDYVTSNQLHRVRRGDVIWVVTVRNGELYLLSKLYVDEVTDREGAKYRLGKDTLWGDKNLFALAPKNQAALILEISLEEITDQLRFTTKSQITNRLLVDSHGVNAQQLQTMRVLEPESVKLLEQLWKV